MRAEVLSGRAMSASMLRRVLHETSGLPRPPCLAVVVVGARPDSALYVSTKRRAAAACGVRFVLRALPDAVTPRRLHAALRALSADAAVDGVLLQLPLPPHLRARPALLCIDPSKDVDGLHPLNAGNLFLHDRPPSQRPLEERYFVPCAAMAVRALLQPRLEALAARDVRAVVLNKSMVVGVPTAALLQREDNVTVTLCGRANGLDALRAVCRTADVLVTALGVPRAITGDFVKDGAVVVDVAINADPTKCGGGAKRRVCGDVDVSSVGEKAAALTPVPGGVGPLTVAFLMQNTLKAYHLAQDCGSIPRKFFSMYTHGPMREDVDVMCDDAADDEESEEGECNYGVV